VQFSAPLQRQVRWFLEWDGVVPVGALPERLAIESPTPRHNPPMHIAILTFPGFNELDSFVARAMGNITPYLPAR
jgi:hypothetical protein